MDGAFSLTAGAAGCALCPRRCGARRGAGETGYCGVGAAALVCRAAPHFGEEPCISGTRGSGAVFFAGCNLRCRFCQNREISRGGAGQPLTVPELRALFLHLRDAGVHNLNLVTPSHYSALLAEALRGLELGIPVVWNSSGYETPQQLRALEGLVQVYMPDFKYRDAALAARCSDAPDYPEVALRAIQEMYRQTGPFQLDAEGLLQRGVLIRHLILPGAAENTLRVIDAVEDHFPPGGVLFSLMSQYTPPGEGHTGAPEAEETPLPPELRRRVSPEEYARCRSYLDFSALEQGYYQDLDSAGTGMIPAFDGTGLEFLRRGSRSSPGPEN